MSKREQERVSILAIYGLIEHLKGTEFHQHEVRKLSEVMNDFKKRWGYKQPEESKEVEAV